MSISNIITTAMRQSWVVAIATAIMGITSWTYDMGTAQAIPAFARKYEVSCNVCHTRQPRLNTFGQRFLENGYQLPGTADGGTAKKSLFGSPIDGATLDDNISNYFAVRLRADIQQAGYRTTTTPMTNAGVGSDPDIIFPRTINLFFAGAATENLGFFLESEYDTQDPAEKMLAFERSLLQFSNIGGQQVANVKVGVFDPASLYAFPTHRQQLNPIKPSAETDVYPPAIARIPLLPLAFATKMFGLSMPGNAALGTPATAGGETYSGADTALSKGFAVLPFAPAMYNAPSQKGVSVHGRPFGNNFLYQLGFAQNLTAENVARTRWDTYAMFRYDMPQGEYSALQFSGFFYNAPKAARPTLKMDVLLANGNTGTDGVADYILADNAVNWTRMGFGARWQHKAWDIYGTYVADTIDAPSFTGVGGGMSTWQTTGSGISIEADYLLNSKWLIGTRFDLMDPGGLKRGMPGWNKDLNQDAAFLAVIGKYYPRPNISFYTRAHFNLLGSEQLPAALGGAEHPARNLTYMLLFGVDMAF